MPIFAYTAEDAAGKTIRGRYEGADEAFVTAALKENGYTVTTLVNDDDNVVDPPVVGVFNTILMQAICHNASEIRIEPEPGTVHLRYLIAGEVSEQPEIARELLAPLAERFKLVADVDTGGRGRIEVEMHDTKYNLQVEMSPGEFGEKIAVRIEDAGRSLTHTTAASSL